MLGIRKPNGHEACPPCLDPSLAVLACVSSQLIIQPHPLIPSFARQSPAGFHPLTWRNPRRNPRRNQRRNPRRNPRRNRERNPVGVDRSCGGVDIPYTALLLRPIPSHTTQETTQGSWNSRVQIVVILKLENAQTNDLENIFILASQSSHLVPVGVTMLSR